MIYITFINPMTKKEISTQVVRCLTIGRSFNADVQIKGDSYVSNLHTLIVPRRDGRLEVRDMASRYGTFVIQRGEKRRLLTGKIDTGEGAEKGRAILADGESFFVSKHEIKVHYEEVLGQPTMGQDYTEEEEEKTDKMEL